MPVSDRQPALDDLVTCLRAPTTVLSGADGQLRGEGAQGVFVADVRVMSAAVLTVAAIPGGAASGGAAAGGGSTAAAVATSPDAAADTEPESVAVATLGADTVEFVSVIRTPWHPVPDPALWLRRRRRADPFGCAEEITVTSVLDAPVDLVIRLRLATDLAGIWAVRAGRPVPRRAWQLVPEGAVVPGTTVSVTTTAAQVAGIGSAAPVPPVLVLGEEGTAVEAVWRVRVDPRCAVRGGWAVHAADPGAVVAPAGEIARLIPPTVQADDRRLAPLVITAIADLDALRMTAAGSPDGRVDAAGSTEGDPRPAASTEGDWRPAGSAEGAPRPAGSADGAFIAAGSPWYLTLFGRDSIWAARMLLPLGTDIAAGTLRTLAARQGRAVDPATGEEPGKILHELRRADDGHASLPPVYYGTVDATPLWVCLLAEAWRFGLDQEVVAGLLPVAERALAWLATYGDADGDGFVEYIDRSGRGLANQGWKDSSDSVRFADGRIAVGPIALAEVQGYAHEAAMAGADLLDAFDRPGADRWRNYAAALADRFRQRFWTSDALGWYPAIALDGDKRPVDAPASNMGHLLGTGMLTAEESAVIAARLADPSMSSGYGLRTMATTAGGYSPLSYHCGTVWPHDTAIAIHGLLRAGQHAEALVLADGLLAAGTAFDGRLPELYAGFGADEIPVPVPYPAACRPQGWSAAAAVVMLRAFLGLEPDVPNGTVALRPTHGLGALRVAGLRVAGADLRVEVDGTGGIRAEVAGGGLRILT